MTDWPLLTLTTFLPLLGALFILTIRGETEVVARNARNVALLTALATFVVSLFILGRFDAASPDFQLKETAAWFPGTTIAYSLGIDGVSLWFVLLSTFLTPLCILSTYRAVHERVKEYMVCFLVLETMMVGMFCALDLVLFYLFFEGVLIPMFIIIGVWGGQRRVYAAFKFFLYTLLGSVLMLVAMLVMYFEAQTTDIPSLMAHSFPIEMQKWLWMAFFASFAVKVPMWPVHTWLPDAHVEAPTAGSVILAGVLLKMGAYGFLRFSLPMLPDASVFFTPLIQVLSVVAVIYTSLVALVQEDIKKLIAYSSVAHMGYVTLGLFAMTPQGVEGALIQMLSHGVVAAALFLGVGVIYDRLHTREIARFGGLATRMPLYAAFFMLFTLASIGLPGTSGFVGEFLVLIGVFQVDRLVAVLTATGVILGAAYMLYLYRRVFFGRLVHEDLKMLPDLSAREILVFLPLAVLVIWMGVHPATFLDPMHASVAKLIDNFELAKAAQAGLAAATR
ncbi:NADH-quinone oxidoreductase subunit M [Magnetospirillum molischianum]|uniref:NADH-quinone oxidoreductase chain M (NADH dehydrogenase I, chain M) (NDH-1, chain M) n=1 Tax=Magnetospirillum molischianum DSM 120 TaxID=1150626 RepID=H8FSL4_MAGML|nr:NADH-quinone oxidoreductase subunit M [Magnetospirillum molischianum]CCG41352.1 NADH-quinone oxidoreductase chain M (NADH dehydrogenase I, chain M) (NDH-1, chain M) [Magnetospirillum molischianum DSM 120]